MKNPETNRPLDGVLLTNLGTPDAPDAAATRRYLREFLWDPMAVVADTARYHPED